MKRTDFIKSIGALSIAPWSAGRFLRRKKGPLQKPPRLRPGDRVGLVAPAGIIYEEKEFVEMQAALSELGLQSRFGKNVRKRDGYFAGTDRERADDLNKMFADPDIDGIMAVRGGWGCSRILPYLDFKMITRNPKVYCGFSDNTTLHHALMEYSGLVSFHGPNGNSDWTELTKQSFRSVVMEGKKTTFRSKSSVQTVAPGRAKGKLIGGNLTILTTTLGTPYQPDASGAILFVEDIGEKVYKIDRMLAHLKQAGVLEQLSGFIFGKCTDCDSGSDPTFTLSEILSHYITPLGIPSIFNVDIGHEVDNFTIPVGIEAELNADTGTFSLLETGVA